MWKAAKTNYEVEGKTTVEFVFQIVYNYFTCESDFSSTLLLCLFARERASNTNSVASASY